MANQSAGVLMFRVRDGRLEFLLAHPGGPFWRNRDCGAWTIPKGEIQEGEQPRCAARREFLEEIGFDPGEARLIQLSAVKQKGGKTIQAWAFEGDWDPRGLKSNLFALEWPPKSGKLKEFPEVDQAEFFTLEEAQDKINPAQLELLLELKRKVEERGGQAQPLPPSGGH